MLTYQDFIRADNKASFVSELILNYKSGEEYRIAKIAEEYDAYNNTTIKMFQKFVYTMTGEKKVDTMSANWKIASAFFRQLATQQAEYSLANGVNFKDRDIDRQLGKEFDDQIKTIARNAIVGGKAYGYFTDNEVICFKATEFVPVYDENTGELAAGVRFYQIDNDKPLNVWLYEIDGYTVYRSENGIDNLTEVEEKKGYKTTYAGTVADGMREIGSENYSKLPIVQLKCNDYGISEISAVRDKIDAYDLMLSGLANDIDENAFIYWLIENAGGMEDRDIMRFKTILKNTHVANIDADEETRVEHFEKDVPTEARQVILDRLKQDIYEAWGAFNPSQVSAGSVTATQIKSAYTTADNKATEFEKHIRAFIQQILRFKNIIVAGYDIEFIRQKLVDENEQATIALTKTQALMLVADELDKETLLTAISKIIPELSDMNVNLVMQKKDAETVDRLTEEE